MTKYILFNVLEDLVVTGKGSSSTPPFCTDGQSRSTVTAAFVALGHSLFFRPICAGQSAGLAIGRLRPVGISPNREVVAVPRRGEQQAPLSRVGRRARRRDGRGVGGLRRGRGRRLDFPQARYTNTDGPESGFKAKSCMNDGSGPNLDRPDIVVRQSLFNSSGRFR